MFDLTFQDFVNLIGNFGFPIALSIYLLFSVDRKIVKLENKLNELTTSLIEKLSKEEEK